VDTQQYNNRTEAWWNIEKRRRKRIIVRWQDWGKNFLTVSGIPLEVIVAGTLAYEFAHYQFILSPDTFLC